MTNVVMLVNGKHRDEGRRLQRTGESVISTQNLEVFQNLEGLSERLHRFPREIAVVVLFPANEDQLSELISLKDYLDGIPLILVLPDGERETISKGYKLYPRFISFINSDFTDVAAVLEKMLMPTYSKGCYAF